MRSPTEQRRKLTKEQRRYLKERCMAHARSIVPNWNEDIEMTPAEIVAARAKIGEWDARQSELRNAIKEKLNTALKDTLEALMFETADIARAASDDFCATAKYHYQP